MHAATVDGDRSKVSRGFDVYGEEFAVNDNVVG